MGKKNPLTCSLRVAIRIDRFFSVRKKKQLFVLLKWVRVRAESRNLRVFRKISSEEGTLVMTDQPDPLGAQHVIIRLFNSLFSDIGFSLPGIKIGFKKFEVLGKKRKKGSYRWTQTRDQQ